MISHQKLEAVTVGLLIFGVMTPFFLFWAGRGAFGTFLGVLGFICLIPVPFLAPIYYIKTGIYSSRGQGGRVRIVRAENPIWFWVFVIFTFVVLATLVYFSARGIWSMIA
jgi:hypothetical protein